MYYFCLNNGKRDCTGYEIIKGSKALFSLRKTNGFLGEICKMLFYLYKSKRACQTLLIFKATHTSLEVGWGTDIFLRMGG